MDISAITSTEIISVVAGLVVVVIATAGFFALQKRRTLRLRTQFGGAEYARALAEGGAGEKRKLGWKTAPIVLTHSTSAHSPQAIGQGSKSRGSEFKGASLTAQAAR